MILLRSPVHESLKDALRQAETSGQAGSWARTMRGEEKRGLDPLLAVVDYGFGNKLFPSESIPSLDVWLNGIDKWQKSITDPRAGTGPGPDVLFQSWQHVSESLIQALRRARLSGTVPKSGGVLCFCAGLSRCLILNYDILGDMPRLHMVSVVNEPRSAFDFWGAIDNADPTARSSLKAILATGHKMIAHRGVLVHVDRRTDTHVFGPSIDTLVLAEVLAQDVFEGKDCPFKTAMEVGCGNGLLTAEIANSTTALREIYALDISFNAVSCTYRNVSTTQRFADKNHATTYYVNGPFQQDMFRQTFDLIVCNPPYIPTPARLHVSGQLADDYTHAVGGTKLARDLLKAAPHLLSARGRMLMMASSLCLDEFLVNVPSHVQVRQVLGDDGIEVLFDVEAVFNKPEWLRFLVDEKNLTPRGDSYYHRLHPLWIEPQPNLF